MDSYEPEDRDNMDQMVTVLANAGNRKELEQMTMLFLLDMSYSRTDLMYAISYTERVLRIK